MAGWRTFLPGGVLGFLLGLIVGTLWAFYPFSFDRTLSVANVLQFLTTILIAFFLQQAIQERYRNLRIEKDLLIGSTKVAQVAADEAYNLCCRAFSEGKIDEASDRQIVVSFRNLTNSITRLEPLSNECGFEIDPEIFSQIKQELIVFKKQSTGGAYPNEPYTREEVTKQGEILRKLHDHLSRFIIKVNRANKGKKVSG